VTIELGNIVHLWLAATGIALIFFAMRWLAGLLITGPSEPIGRAIAALYQ
jgi:hypothetical protein